MLLDDTHINAAFIQTSLIVFVYRAWELPGAVTALCCLAGVSAMNGRPRWTIFLCPDVLSVLTILAGSI